MRTWGEHSRRTMCNVQTRDKGEYNGLAMTQQIGWVAVRGAGLYFIPLCVLLSFPPLGTLLAFMEYCQTKFSSHLSEINVSFFSFHQEELTLSSPDF